MHTVGLTYMHDLLTEHITNVINEQHSLEVWRRFANVPYTLVNANTESRRLHLVESPVNCVLHSMWAKFRRIYRTELQ